MRPDSFAAEPMFLIHRHLGFWRTSEHEFQWEGQSHGSWPLLLGIVLATFVSPASQEIDFQQSEMWTFWYEIICFLKAGKPVTFATNNSGAKHNTSVVHTGCQLPLCPLVTCWQEGVTLLDKGLDCTRDSSIGGAAWFWLKPIPLLS